MNNLAPMRNCPGVEGRLYQSMREFCMCKIWTAKYSGWGKSIQMGLISAILSNAKLHQCSKVYTFKL